MAFMFYLTLIVLVLGGLAYGLAWSNPAKLARGIGLAGPAILGVAGVGLILVGRGGLGGFALSAAAAWYGSTRMQAARQRTAGGRSSVRSAALEMDLDHDTGSLEGVVLAGRFEGRRLGTLAEAELLSLHTELAGDPESVQLLEAYLDGRMPGWRDDREPDPGPGQRGAPGAGPMTEQEAYQILGLESGASASEIRQAHRRLMQRLHPDLGGSSFLAARINEAKDVLLSHHD